MKKKILFAVFMLLTVAVFAGSYTTFLNLYKPTEGDIGWADLVNTNFDLIDTAVGTEHNTNGTHKADVIDDTNIDWGTGSNQVSADDVPDGSTNVIITSTQESNLGTAYTHSQNDNDLLTTNEINTITGDDTNTTTGLDITVAGGGINATAVSGDTVTITATEADTLDSVAERGATTDVNLTLDKGGMVNTVLNVNGSVDSYLRSTATDLFQIGHNGNVPVTLKSTGEVGISNSNPSEALDVTGNIAVSGTVDGKDISALPDGSGTSNYVTKWSDSDTLTDSTIYDDGTNVGIGTTSPIEALDIGGSFVFNTTLDQFNTQPYTTTDSGSGSGGVSNADLLDDDCSSFTGWTSFSFGTVGANQQILYNGDETFNFSITSATSSLDVTGRHRTVTTSNRVTKTMVVELASASQTTSGTGDWSGAYYKWQIEELADNDAILFHVNPDGLFYSDGTTLTTAYSTSFSVGTQTKYIITTDYNKTTNLMDIWIDNVKVVTGQTPEKSASASSTDYLLYGVSCYGSNTANVYISEIKVGTDLTAAGTQNLVNAFTSYGSLLTAPTVEAYSSTYIDTDNDNLGNAEIGNNLYVLGETTMDGDLAVDTDLFTTDILSGYVGVSNPSPTAELDVDGDIVIGDDLTVDTDTFKVDSLANNVGIGTTAPSSKLQVIGSATITTTLNAGTDTLFVEESGNVGVGDITPTYKLDVLGNLRSTSGAYFATSSGNVGIGTISPTAKLDVAGRVVEEGTFAEIHVHDASTAQSIASGVAYTKLTAYTDNGGSSNCTADATNDKITITKTGMYLVNGAFNFISGTANVIWFGAPFLNAVEQDQIHWHRKCSTSTDVGSASFSGIIDVTSVPVDLDVRLRHDNGSATDITVSYSNFTVVYLGET